MEIILGKNRKWKRYTVIFTLQLIVLKLKKLIETLRKELSMR